MHRKIAIVFTLIAMFAYAVVSFSTVANNASIEERFAAAADSGVTGRYNFDPAHTSIGFKVKHLGLVEVPGYFRDFTGSIDYNSADPTKSSVSFTAKTTSVDTGVAARDNHLRTGDFFEVAKFPEMTFVGKSISKKGNAHVLIGDLTMKGVTKSVSIPFTITGFLPDQRSGGTRIGVVGETTINRRDFGVNYGGNLPNGAAMLSDEIKVILNIEALNVPAK